MRATFRLLNSYFWKTYYGPIIAFIFPIIILSIVGNIFSIQYVLPGILAMSTMFIAVLALPLAIMELRGSSLFKYIGASPVNPKKFSLVAIGFYVFIIFTSIIVTMIAAIALFHNKIFAESTVLIKLDANNVHLLTQEIPKDLDGNYIIPDAIKPYIFNVPQGIFSGISTPGGFFSFIFANLLHIIMSVGIGLLISTFSRTPQQALTTSLIIVIPSMFLSGMVISVDIIGQSKVMQWFSRFFPFKYTTGNIVESMTPLSQVNLYYNAEQWNLLHANADLRDMITSGQIPIMNSTSPGIFNFGTGFSVRRVSGVDPIKQFVQKFLGKGNFGGINITEDFGWLDVFTHLNSRLYTVTEKVLNIFLPVLIATSCFAYTAKNFKWSTR